MKWNKIVTKTKTLTSTNIIFRIQRTFEALLTGPKDYGYTLNGIYLIKSSRMRDYTQKMTKQMWSGEPFFDSNKWNKFRKAYASLHLLRADEQIISDLYLSLVPHMNISFVFECEFSLFLRFNSYLNEASCSLRNAFGLWWQLAKGVKSPVAIHAFRIVMEPACFGWHQPKWMQRIYYSHSNHFQMNGVPPKVRSLSEVQLFRVSVTLDTKTMPNSSFIVVNYHMLATINCDPSICNKRIIIYLTRRKSIYFIIIIWMNAINCRQCWTYRALLFVRKWFNSSFIAWNGTKHLHILAVFISRILSSLS